jgi:hypothetical protein
MLKETEFARGQHESSQYIYLDSKLIEPVVYFADPVRSKILRGNDISSVSVTGCHLWSLGDLRRHTELHYVG